MLKNLAISNARKQTDISNYYDIIPRIGDGHVLKDALCICTHKGTGFKYTLKTCYKSHNGVDRQERIHQEIKTIADLDHPNIIRIHDVFETVNTVQLILDCCVTDLYQRLQQSPGSHFEERIACKMIQDLLRAIRYCHSHNIVHRNLKLENIFFEDSHLNSLVITDFGLSCTASPTDVLRHPVGTPYYVAPEVLAGEYDAKCDIWSIGVIAYMLLSGSPPFQGRNDKEIVAEVRQGRLSFPSDLFKHVSSDAQAFVASCLRKDVVGRPSAAKAQNHSWFDLISDNDNDTGNVSTTVSPDIYRRLQAFSDISRLSRLCLQAVAYSLSADQARDIREQFSRLDVEEAGELSLEDLCSAFQDTVHGFHRTDAEKMFVCMNRPQSGHMNYLWFIAATITKNHLKEENMKLAFEK
eukprot:gene7327-14947_t